MSEELRDKPPVYTFPDFQIVVEDPVVAGGRKRKLKDRRKSQEKAPVGLRPLAEVTCFFCKLKGHYANHCPKKLAATSRFCSKPVIRSLVPASQQGGPCNPFAEITCFFCNCKGHYANKCPLKQQKISRTQVNSTAAGKHSGDN